MSFHLNPFIILPFSSLSNINHCHLPLYLYIKFCFFGKKNCDAKKAATGKIPATAQKSGPDGKKYLDYAEKILKSLSSDAYLAKVGENQGFILMHSVGSLPNGSEIDTPLNYADYYYLEALKRFMDLKKLRLENGEVKVIE